MTVYRQLIVLITLVPLVGAGVVRSQDDLDRERVEELVQKLKGEGNHKTRSLSIPKATAKPFNTAGIPRIVVDQNQVNKERKTAKVSGIEVDTLSTEGQEELSTVRKELPGGGTLTLSMPKATSIGQRTGIEIVGSEDMFIRVYHFSSDHFQTELYPRKASTSGSRPAGKMLSISWETTQPGGNESVVVFASSKPIERTIRTNLANTSLVFEENGVLAVSPGEEKTPEEVIDSIESLTIAKIGYDLKDDETESSYP